jgi:hypothetical protein
LERWLHRIRISDIKPGDVFIKGGFMGHAMKVMDVAKNNPGKTIFMLAQSYMPAQDIHFIKNPAKDNDSWYELSDDAYIVTPEWTFKRNQLRRW